MTFWVMVICIEGAIIYKMYRKHSNNLKPFHLSMMILMGEREKVLCIIVNKLFH